MKEFHLDLSAKRLHHWDFTIFRTVYVPENDAAFQSLLDAMHSGVRKTIMSLAGPDSHGLDKEPDAELVELCERAVSMFYIRVEDDKTAFEGASLEQLRGIVREVEDDERAREREQIFTITEDMERRPLRLGEKRVFLVADEVLRSVEEAKAAGGEPRVKVVDVDHVVYRDPVNRRFPKYYRGWMFASAGHMKQLWEYLNMLSLEEIAPWIGENEQPSIWSGSWTSQS